MRRLSIVIPAYSEEARLPSSILRIGEYFATRGASWEVVVVDDGSTDRTVEVAEKALAGYGGASRVLRHPTNRGKGAAVRTGMLAARGDLVLFTDADLSTPIEEIEKLERAIAAGAKIAIGSRAVDRRTVERRQPWVRDMTGRLFNFVVRLFAVRGIKDTQCGFKLFTRETIRPIFERTRIDGFGFDVEVLALAQRLGFPIAEVPVRWINNTDTRVRFAQGAKAFLDPLRVRLGMLRGVYDRPVASGDAVMASAPRTRVERGSRRRSVRR
ncbi:MAG TPA: dolichyl-phosphate beta-glucosyltransferase [Candidatus Binatia bacterium]|nr:dolichyl-phosphate beta-glucosyltransferase [Candidatus Binatia bacterium]